MEISIRSITFLITILLTALSAGLFFAWSVSVIPGTKRLTDQAYLESMQAINRAILNPTFFVVFIGSLLLLGLSTFMHFREGVVFWFILAAFLSYLLGTFGITAFGNVPLNNTLDGLNLASLTPEEVTYWRSFYERKWNQLHTLRTIFALLSFLLLLIVKLLH